MKRLLIFLLAATCLPGMAQKKGQPLLDSLLGVLPHLPDDSNKVGLLGRIVRVELQLNPREGIPFAEQGLALAQKINWKKGIAFSHNNLGLLIGDTGNNAVARVHFEESYAINKVLDAKFDLINNLNNLGRSYQRESNFLKATDCYFQALAVAESIKSPEQIALVATNITSGFYAQRNLVKAAEYAEMALKNGRLSNTPNNIGKALTQLGTIKMESGDSVSAKRYLQQALDIYKTAGNKPQIAQVLGNMASLEYPDTKKELALLLEAQRIYDDIGPFSVGSVSNLDNIGQTYLEAAKAGKTAERAGYLEKATLFLNRAKMTAQQTANAETLADILAASSELESEKGNYKAALEDFKQYHGINDSLFSQDKKNEIAGLESKHSLELKDNELGVNKIMLANQRRAEWGLIAGVGLLVVIGTLLFQQSQRRKKMNDTLRVLNTRLDEANKTKARFFGILSHDLRGPVASLVHFLGLQKDSPDLLTEAEAATYRQDISTSAENLLHTMEAMLLWSKEQMGSFKPTFRPVAVVELFDHVRQFVLPTANIRLLFEQEEGLEMTTDENYLRTIMQNLTANAVRALKDTERGVVTWRAFKDGTKTVLSISDNGPGIAPEQTAALFDDRVADNGSRGFGFHLVRDLAKAIRLTITVRSDPGERSVFVLSPED